MDESTLFKEINTLSKSQVLASKNLDEIINEVGLRICKCLKIERVNIWLYSEERDFIRSIGELSDYGNQFSKGSIYLRKISPNTLII